MLGMFLRYLLAIFETNEHTAESQMIVMTEQELERDAKNLNDDDAFKFFFGLGNLDEDFNILDNEYVRIVGYNMFSQDGIETLEDTY